MLSIEQQTIYFTSEPKSQTGPFRYSPTFQLAIENVVLIGFAPRLIYEDESGFIILVDKSGSIFYFNLDLAETISIQKLAEVFGFTLRYYFVDQDYTYEEYSKGITEVVYPPHLVGKPLFKPWSWFSPRGFAKKFGYAMGTDKPIWERLTDEMKAYINQKRH